ncbi:hypothetical protein T07_10523 [Trichinella nelsoni]|uniref:Uncharacterized protein n=1 Tax=Trichinella nelsoni TaxID=6336 RepID=A0A0V0S1Q7_9BILA|nr:hypothetical protein T07_10523 [Trichinella nelsoni]
MITDQKHLDSKQSNNLGMKRELLISAQGVLYLDEKCSIVAYECSFDVGMRRRPPRCGSSIVKSLPNGELRVTALISGKSANRKSIKFLHLSEISNPNIGETLNSDLKKKLASSTFHCISEKRNEEGLVAFDNDDDDDDDATASNRMHL